ncbi:MAG: DUF305 domain-containing protein [Gemmatimonadales bacterium]
MFRVLHLRASLAAAGLLAALSASPAASQTFPATPAGAPNPADVNFMTGMIPHHAQAVLIAGWAVERTVRPDLKVLAERIIVAQRDEIELMRMWLQDRGQPVPAADATHHRMVHDGMEHDMLMPGMLTEADLKQLREASGSEFDRLFLTFMIRHHDGALVMVEELFGSYGAAQDEVVFRFASDVFADQTTEIDRMQQMLTSLPAP